MPASGSGYRSPVKRAIAAPCEKPASTMRDDGTPRSISRAISASTAAAERRMPASSCPRASRLTMSYQARMRMPMFRVTAISGAWGKT